MMEAGSMLNALKFLNATTQRTSDKTCNLGRKGASLRNRELPNIEDLLIKNLQNGNVFRRFDLAKRSAFVNFIC